jgi:hypothetical protein
MGKAGFCAACWSPKKARCLQCGCYSDGSRIGGGVGTGRQAAIGFRQRNEIRVALLVDDCGYEGLSGIQMQ